MNAKHADSKVKKYEARKAEEAEKRARVDAQIRTARRYVVDRLEAMAARLAIQTHLRTREPIMGFLYDGIFAAELEACDLAGETNIPGWAFLLATTQLEAGDFSWDRVHTHMHEILGDKSCKVCARDAEVRVKQYVPLEERTMLALGVTPIVVQR